MLAQEPSIWPAEVRNAVKDIPPKIEIITLMDDAMIITEFQPGTAKYRCAGIFIETHDHLPLDEHHVAILKHVLDFHGQLLAAFCQAITHRLEVLNAFDALDAVFKNNVIAIIREDV